MIAWWDPIPTDEKKLRHCSFGGLYLTPNRMAEPNPHDLVSCPYNISHQVEHYRLHIHLQKCRKQHTNCNKVTCPFDATHVVNDVELDYHVRVCPKRHMFDRQLYLVGDEARAPVPVSAPPVLDCSENWDDENVTSYKPDPDKLGNHIIRKARGLTPSERKQVRMQGIKTFKPPQE